MGEADRIKGDLQSLSRKLEQEAEYLKERARKPGNYQKSTSEIEILIANLGLMVSEGLYKAAELADAVAEEERKLEGRGGYIRHLERRIKFLEEEHGLEEEE